MGRITLSPTHRGLGGSSSRGFTLIELLVGVVTTGLLAAFVAPRNFDQVRKSSARMAKAQITSLGQALDRSLRAVKPEAEGSKAEGSGQQIGGQST